MIADFFQNDKMQEVVGTVPSQKKSMSLGTVNHVSEFSRTTAQSPPLQEGGWQSLDGRPVGIYRGTDRLSKVAKDVVIGLVSQSLDFVEIWEKGQEQITRLGNRVAEWVQEHSAAGFVGAWRMRGIQNTDGVPMLDAMFVIAQADTNGLDETLWLDVARFDVQIAGMSEFANIRTSFIPVPYMTEDQITSYLHMRCETWSE